MSWMQISTQILFHLFYVLFKSGVTLCFILTVTDNNTIYLTADDFIQVSCPTNTTQKTIRLEAALTNTIETTSTLDVDAITTTYIHTSKVPEIADEDIGHFIRSFLPLKCLFFSCTRQHTDQQKRKLGLALQSRWFDSFEPEQHVVTKLFF